MGSEKVLGGGIWVSGCQGEEELGIRDLDHTFDSLGAFNFCNSFRKEKFSFVSALITVFVRHLSEMLLRRRSSTAFFNSDFVSNNLMFTRCKSI